ncbi:MAG: cytochrome C peroxidase [Akkermansiaceae bacterium]|nr:cytochrome C peroxidase [Akkermansiaceae bacterium]
MRLLPAILILLAALPAGAGTLTLQVRHLWDGEELRLPTGATPTKAGETISITRLSYLLSQPRLLRRGDSVRSGDWWSRDDWFAFVDASGGTPEPTLEEVPAGTYGSLRFTIGLDEQTDRADPNRHAAGHPLNPLVNNLHWAPQGGYIFLALEGHLHANEPTGFAYHLGNAPNRMTVTVPLHLEMRGDSLVILDFHLDRLFNRDPAFAVAPQASTHSRPGDPVATLLKERVEGAITLHAVRAAPTPAPPAPAGFAERPVVGTPYEFTVKRGFPIPALPTDYPLTEERVRLGGSLFYDMDLSKSNTLACASCHNPTYALTDGVPLATGDDGSVGTRNTMPLINLAWKDKLLWDGRVDRIRDQIVIPITHPREMNESVENVIAEMEARPAYRRRFEEAFGSPGITIERIGVALEQFLLTKTSYDSRFDRAARGEGKERLTEQEKRGFELFMTEYDPRRGQLGADCFHCHGGPFFTDHRFHDNGLYDAADLGLFTATGRDSDKGKFSTPSLRNVALTAPYMHDGRFATLEEVVAHYNGPLDRRHNLDPNLAKHPAAGIQLPAADQAALVAFLRTLTDPALEEE